MRTLIRRHGALCILLSAFALALSLAGPAIAQSGASPASGDQRTLTTGARWGFQLGRYQDDFAFGLNLTTSRFANDRLALRLQSNLAFHEHLTGESGSRTETWSPYANASVGLVGLTGRVSESIRLYGEGGAIGIVPSNTFSEETVAVGGYGLFGFSFFADTNRSWFIEIGGVGTAARAGQLPTNPVYSNGLTIRVGSRGGF